MNSPLPCSIRNDLKLIEGEADENGYPNWLVYDSTKHKYYLIGWLEFEILNRWPLGCLENIIESVNKETTLTINAAHIEKVIAFLYQNELAVLEQASSMAPLIKKRISDSYFKKFLHSYLFFIIPLFKPNDFLEKTLPFVKKIFINKTFLYLFFFIAVIGFYLTIRQWSQFFNTFDYTFSLENIIAFTISILFVKIIHELGHAYSAKYKGCNVSTIGVAFLVMWPVMYTDTTDAWKLKHKKDRLIIAAGGIIAEFFLAIFALFLWHFVPVGICQSILFFIATISLVTSILINTNPLLRFDGYYFFADLIGVDNLQNTAFTVGAWKLRECLFKFNEPAPIVYPKKRERLLIFYAYFTWIYRFFLFLSIALLVYYFFFKVLGLILMSVEILFFILLPITRELKNYWQRRKQISMNKNTFITFTTLTVTILLFIIPWHSQITTPAIIEFNQQTKVFSQVDGVIKKINYRNGGFVIKNQTLMQLDNADIKHQIALATLDIEQIKTRIRQETGRSTTLGFKQANMKELHSKESKRLGLQQEYKKLNIKAPFLGQFFSPTKGYQPGVWVGKNTLIGELINTKKPVIYAYVNEKELHRVPLGAKAIFYPTEDNGNKLKLIVSAIDTAATEILPSPYLSSIYGGDIAATTTNENKIKIKQALYRIELKPSEKLIALNNIIRGKVIIKGTRESYAKRVWQLINAVVIRESMF